MYILSVHNNYSGKHFNIQTNESNLLTEKAMAYIKRVSWDNMLHEIPSSCLTKTVASKYSIWGREGVAKTIGDVFDYCTSLGVKCNVEVKGAAGLTLYTGPFEKLPKILKNVIFIYSFKVKGNYIFEVRGNRNECCE